MEQLISNSPQPMFEEYPDNLDEACTNYKSHKSETNGNQWPYLQFPPKTDPHGARSAVLSITWIMMSRLPAVNNLILRTQSITYRLHFIAP